MTKPIDIHLADRRMGTVPERIAFVREFEAEAPIFDPSAGFKSTRYHQTQIYSLQARPEMVSVGDDFTLVMDLRFVEICFDLVQAVRQPTELLTHEFLYFIISRILLEQLTTFPSGPYHVGAFLDYVVSRASQPLGPGAAEGGLEELPIKERQRCVEFITKFTAVHEITHYALANDEQFVRDWCRSLDARLQHFKNIFSTASPTGDTAPYIMEGLDALLSAMAEFHRTGRLSLELEECICDFSASTSLVEALSQRRPLSESIAYCGQLVWALIATRWLVVTINLALRGAFEREVIDLTQAMHLLLNRGSMGILLLFSLIGERLHGSPEASQKMLVTAWTEQPDFEEFVTGVINTIFSGDNFQRFRVIGETAQATGATEMRQTQGAILRLFEWPSP